MSDLNPIGQFGPPPFRFTPTLTPMVCRAFSRTFCLLAVAMVVGCAYWVFVLWSTGKLTTGAGSAAASGLNWALAALALMVYTLWCILTSVTTLTNSTIEQTFVWNKKLDLRELAYVKLIRVPGLDWLIAPRLYCRTLLGKFAVFYTSDVAMVADFERLRDELSAFRKMR
jgi:ABC-type multidrug transport system fused ATPase/permease subunit